MTECPKCYGPGQMLGSLGNLVHLRCRNCGWTYSITQDDDIEDEPAEEDDSEPDDRFADSDALASAGFGTDEDYGCFNSGDEG